MNRTIIPDAVGQQSLGTVHSSDSVRAVVHLMARRHIGAVPVLDADGALVGIFTERDVMCRVVGRDLDPAGPSVADVMTPSPVTAAPDWPILRPLEQMAAGGDRKSLVYGKSVAERVDLGGRRSIKTKNI